MKIISRNSLPLLYSVQPIYSYMILYRICHVAWRILCIVLPSPLARLEHIPCGLYPCHSPCIGNSISWTSFTTGVTGKLAAFNILDAETVCIVLGLVLPSLGRAEAPYYIDFLVRYTGVTLISG